MSHGVHPSSGALARWVAGVLPRRRLWLGFWALAVLALAPGVARLERDNSPEAFFLAGSPDVELYHEFVARYGRDEAVRFAVAGDALWSRAGLDFLARVEREAAALAGARRMVGPFGRHRAAFPDPGTAAPLALRALLLDSALDRSLGLIATDGELVTVLLETEALAPAAARELYAALDRLAAEAPAGISAFAVGQRSVELALDDSTREIDRVFFPILIVLAALLLFATFRELSAVALPFAFVATCELATLGVMGWLGVRVSLIVAVLPPLLFVITLATAMHLLIRCRALEGEGLDAVAATLATYREKGPAVVAAALTTAAGFLALAASPVRPVRALGLWAGFGLCLMLVAAVTLLPALLATVAAHRRALPERSLEARLERLGRRLAALSAAHPVPIVVGYGLLALVALAGLPRLAVESNALAYLPDDHPVRVRTARLEAAGVGVSSVELWVEPAAATAPLDGADALGRLAELAARLAAEPPALAAVSITDVVDGVAATTPFAALPASSRRPGVLALLRADDEGARTAARFLEPDGRSTRITLFVETVGYPRLEPLLALARSEAARRFPEARIATTGSYLLLLALQRYLLTTVGLALSLTLPALVVALALLLRRASWVARALAASLWPVVAIFGGMAWLGAPLDIATVMVASIVLGLVIDNTLHTLAGYRERRARLGAREAVVAKVESAAPAYLLTGAILAAGFGVCALADFRPTARFGVLSATAIGLAVVADLTLVPALFGGFGRPARGGAADRADGRNRID